MTQFIYNITNTTTIRVSSFYVNYGYNSNITKYETTKVRAERANIVVEQLITSHRELTTDLQFLTIKTKKYYDRDRFEKINFKMRDKAYVFRKNIKTTKKNNKLNHVKIGSFKVIKNIKNISYEFKLSDSINRKYSVFHAALLESAHPNTSIVSISKGYIQSDEKYKIERILNKQLIDGELHYLIK